MLADCREHWFRCKGMGIFAPVFAPPRMPKKMPAPVTSLPFNELPYAIYKVNYKNASFVLNGTQYEELIVTVSPNTVKFTTTAVATPLSITEVVQQFQFGGGPFEAIFTVFNGQDVAYPLLEHARNSLFELTFFKGLPARMQISMNIQDLGELTFLSTEKRSEDEDGAEIEDEVALLRE